MQISQLLRGLNLREDHIGQDIEITSLCCDSRILQADAFFVALPGYRFDGGDFIAEAIRKGARAVLCARPPTWPGPWLVVDDTRAALAMLAANWFAHPARQMTLLGVTGTNGKTTTTYLLKAMLEDVAGAKVGLIGTNQNMIGEAVLPTGRTTPEAYELHELLRHMADAGCTHVVMEVSSHALMLHRVDGICFKAAIFTNLTQDHLDFHGSMEAYRAAKGRLFLQSETGIYNLDDEAGRFYAATPPHATFTYSENKPEANLQAVNIRLCADRVEFEALTLQHIHRVRLPIPGGFSIYNALGVLACGLVLGYPLAPLAASLATAHGIKGRVELVPTPAPYTVLIDYAHTPNALENILLTAREFTQKRLICLFGCGGDRDRTKRPLMGELAATLSDLVVLTSDNPRSEAPEAILEDIAAGFPKNFAALYREADRRRAIALALSLGEVGDVLVLCGKGHETYQEIGSQRVHFDEREEIAAYFAGKN